MKIISAGSLFGDNYKYLELKALVKKQKPDVLIITGDLFPHPKESPLLQSDYLETCVNHFTFLAKYCDKVLYIFGEDDSFAMDGIFNEMITEKVDNVISLNHQNYNYSGYTFIGLPYVKDNPQPLKDWVRTDSAIVNFSDNNGYYTDEEFNLIHIGNAYKFIVDKPEISIELRYRMTDALPNKILVTHFPPKLEGIYFDEYYNLCLNDLITDFDFIFCGHMKEGNLSLNYFTTTFEDTPIFNHGYLKSMLLYTMLILDKDGMKYYYHPLNRDIQSLNENAAIYRKL